MCYDWGRAVCGIPGRAPMEVLLRDAEGSMYDDMTRRMDAADRFIGRLDELAPAEWREIALAHHPRHEFYSLALQLVNDATQLAGEPLASTYEDFLAERYRRIDSIIAR